MANITVSRSKLVVNMLGKPDMVKTMEGDNARYMVGSIFGIAEKVRMKVAPDKSGTPQSYESIVGNFEGVPATPIKTDEGDITAIQSGVLYLPAGIHERVAAALKGDDAAPIRFAVEVYSIKAKNPAGYSWEMKAILPPSESDPLSELRNAVAASQKKIAGPTTAPKK